MKSQERKSLIAGALVGALNMLQNQVYDEIVRVHEKQGKLVPPMNHLPEINEILKVRAGIMMGHGISTTNTQILQTLAMMQQSMRVSHEEWEEMGLMPREKAR